MTSIQPFKLSYLIDIHGSDGLAGAREREIFHFQ